MLVQDTANLGAMQYLFHSVGRATAFVMFDNFDIICFFALTTGQTSLLCEPACKSFYPSFWRLSLRLNKIPTRINREFDIEF